MGKRQRKANKKTERVPFEGEALPDLPPRLAMEQMMRQMFGGVTGRGKGRTAKEEAQDLAYAAMEAVEAGRPEEAVDLAVQAVELHDGCVDALVLLAQAGSESPTELIEHMTRAVAAGERELGRRCFEEDRGHFWGLLETRPYMRARASLAQLLAEAGRTDEAIGHYEAMLGLNPNDKQGLRYVLMGLYLCSGRLDGATRLFDDFEGEGSAMFAWARVLERHMTGDLPGATKALAEAKKTNRHVAPLLTGRKRMPRQMPPYYGIGDEDEAVVCVAAIGEAWRKQPAALAWLAR